MNNAKDHPEAGIPGADAYCRLSDREKDIELQKSLNRIYNLIYPVTPDNKES